MVIHKQPSRRILSIVSVSRLELVVLFSRAIFLGHSPRLDGIEEISNYHLAYLAIVVLVGLLAISQFRCSDHS